MLKLMPPPAEARESLWWAHWTASGRTVGVIVVWALSANQAKSRARSRARKQMGTTTPAVGPMPFEIPRADVGRLLVGDDIRRTVSRWRKARKGVQHK